MGGSSSADKGRGSRDRQAGILGQHGGPSGAKAGGITGSSQSHRPSRTVQLSPSPVWSPSAGEVPVMSWAGACKQ